MSESRRAEAGAGTGRGPASAPTLARPTGPDQMYETPDREAPHSSIWSGHASEIRTRCTTATSQPTRVSYLWSGAERRPIRCTRHIAVKASRSSLRSRPTCHTGTTSTTRRPLEAPGSYIWSGHPSEIRTRCTTAKGHQARLPQPVTLSMGKIRPRRSGASTRCEADNDEVGIRHLKLHTSHSEVRRVGRRYTATVAKWTLALGGILLRDIGALLTGRVFYVKCSFPGWR